MNSQDYIHKYLESPIKPNIDDKLYKAFELTNKIKSVAVSDTSTEKSALCFVLNRGAIHDNVEGISHFIEHMVHLGSAEYPEEQKYKTFLSEHGGSSNAATSSTSTYYFFDIVNESFEEAVKIFSAMLFQPLFKDEAMRREIHAIENEYRLNYQSDDRRVYNLYKSFVGGHPFSKFSTGNIQTLGKVKSSDLRRFFAENYIGSNIQIAAVSNKSLEEIEQLICGNFNRFSDSDTKSTKIDLNPFEALNNLFIKCVPVKHKKVLSLNWSLPSIYKKWRSKKLSLICFCVEHRGKGSLLSFLKNENLASGLSCYVNYNFEFGSVLTVDVKLTDKGLEQFKVIIKLVLEYITLLKNSSESDLTKILNDIVQISGLHFNFKSKKTAIQEAKSIALNLKKYGSQNVLKGPFNYDLSNVLESKQFIERLTLKNCFVVLMAKEIAKDCTNEEKWYKVKYTKSCLDGDLKDIRKSSAEVLQKVKFELPSINTFIPTDLQLKTGEEQSLVDPPLEITRFNNDFALCWLKKITGFKVPKCVINAEIQFCEAIETAKNKILLELLLKLASENLTENLYNANICEYTKTLKVTQFGIETKFSGYTNKIFDFVKLVVNEIIHTDFDQISEKTFHRIKTELIERYKNVNLGRSIAYASRKRCELLKKNIFTNEQYLEILESGDITKKSIQNFGKLFLQFKKGIQLLFVGNIDTVLSEEIGNYLKEAFRIDQNGLHRDFWVKPQLLRIPVNGIYLDFDHAVDHNSCVKIESEMSSYSDKSLTLALIFTKLIKLPFFDFVRTKNSKAYLVKSSITNESDLIYFKQTIVSSNATLPDLVKTVFNFNSKISGILNSVSDSNFLSVINALKNDLESKPKNLREVAGHLWKEISAKQYRFDRNRRVISEIQRVHKREVLDFWKETFLAQRTRGNKFGKSLVICVKKGNVFAEKMDFGKMRKSLGVLRRC